MVTSTNAARQLERVDYGKIWWVTLVAAGVAAVINAIIFIIGDALGAFPKTVLLPSNNEPLSLGAVIFISIVGVIAGGIVFAVIGRFSRRPIRLFTIVALVFLVLSFGSPFSVPNAPAGYIIALLLMHVVAGLAIIGLLTTLARRQIN